MKASHRISPTRFSLLLLLACAMVGCGKAQSDSKAQGNLQEAIKARTEAVALHGDVAANVLGQLTGEREAAKAMQAMRKVIAKAESKQEEGNILLTKDRYGDAAEAYNESAKLYRQALDWRKVQKDLAKAERGAVTARMLAEAGGKTNQVAEARKLQINAEGYLEAGEIDKAIAEYEKARKSFEALIPGQGEATLEQAIAARTAMQAARDQIKNLPRFVAGRADIESLLARRETDTEAKGPKPGSMPDLLGRAQKAETAATEGLEERQYASAHGLFAAAEKLYREAAVLQGKREQVQASRKSVEDSMTLANKAFKSEARPASFERGKQSLTDADKALADDDFDNAKKSLTQAAKTKASDAQAKASAGQTDAATAQFKQATADLKEAVAIAKTKENTAKAAPVITRLETAVASKDKFQAEDVLAELENLIPSDSRMAALRDKVTALPGPKKKLTIDCGGGVTMEFVLIRPGSLLMGDKPGHKVTITKPFYLGKYEVTQGQGQSVMGTNPSNFKDPKKPVEQVSWDDCQDFVRKLKEKAPGSEFCLPTEAQWEYACRAGTTTEYGFGDSESSLGEYAWYSGNSGSTTQAVGEKKPNPWGLYDMHGNVWEWCADWYGDYPTGEATDPAGPASGSYRVLRGGSWNYYASGLRCALRNYDAPTFRFSSAGLRVCGGLVR